VFTDFTTRWRITQRARQWRRLVCFSRVVSLKAANVAVLIVTKLVVFHMSVVTGPVGVRYPQQNAAACAGCKLTPVQECCIQTQSLRHVPFMLEIES